MIGVHIARELIAEKRDVVIIEKDAERSRVVSNELDCMVINDDGCSADVIMKAGASSSAWFLALTGSDEVNMVSCGLAAAGSPGINTVARVANPFYSALSSGQLKALGVGSVIDPSRETAGQVAAIVEQGFAEAVIPLHGGSIQLRRVEADELPDFLGRSLREVKENQNRSFLAAAVCTDTGFEVPSGDYVVQPGDTLYLLGKPDELDTVAGPVDALKIAARKVLIVGATDICKRLIEKLHQRERVVGRGLGKALEKVYRGRQQISVLDVCRDDAKSIAKTFPGVDVSYGDSSEDGVLEQVGAAKADLVVCVTESQSFNVLTAQLAKILGARKSVAVTQNDRYMSILPTLEVDALVSVKSAVSAAVLELVRTAHIRTLYMFHEAEAEVVELELAPQSPAVGKKLMDLDLPKGVLVAFIIRGGAISVPSGSALMHGGDVLGFVLAKADIPALERVFGGRRGD